MGLSRLSNKCLCYADFCSTVKYLRHLDTKQWAPSATKQEPGCSCKVNMNKGFIRETLEMQSGQPDIH